MSAKKVSREDLIKELEFERLTKERQEELESTLNIIRDKREISHYHSQSNFVTRSPILSVTQKAVYNVITSFAFGDKITARPLRETIAKMAPCSEKSVSNAVVFLEKIGLLQVEVVHLYGKTRNIYILLPIDDEMKAILSGEKEIEAIVTKATEEKEEAKQKAKAKKIKLSAKLEEKLDGKTNKKALEIIQTNEEVISTLEQLFRLDKKNKYQGEARPGEVVKVYLHTLQKGEILSEQDIRIVDSLLVEGYQAKPIMNTITKGFTLGSVEFKKELDKLQETQKKISSAIVEIKTYGAMTETKTKIVSDAIGYKPNKNEKIETVGAFKDFDLDLLED